MRAPGGERGCLERAEPGETTRDEGERPSATRAGRVPVRMCADAGAFRPPTRATEAFAAMRRTPHALRLRSHRHVRHARGKSRHRAFDLERARSRVFSEPRVPRQPSARLRARSRRRATGPRDRREWIDPFVLVFVDSVKQSKQSETWRVAPLPGAHPRFSTVHRAAVSAAASCRRLMNVGSLSSRVSVRFSGNKSLRAFVPLPPHAPQSVATRRTRALRPRARGTARDRGGTRGAASRVGGGRTTRAERVDARERVVGVSRRRRLPVSASARDGEATPDVARGVGRDATGDGSSGTGDDDVREDPRRRCASRPTASSRHAPHPPAGPPPERTETPPSDPSSSSSSVPLPLHKPKPQLTVVRRSWLSVSSTPCTAATRRWRRARRRWARRS